MSALAVMSCLLAGCWIVDQLRRMGTSLHKSFGRWRACLSGTAICTVCMTDQVPRLACDKAILREHKCSFLHGPNLLIEATSRVKDFDVFFTNSASEFKTAEPLLRGHRAGGGVESAMKNIACHGYYCWLRYERNESGDYHTAYLYTPCV